MNWTAWKDKVLSKWTPESEARSIEDRVRKINSAGALEAALPEAVAPIDWENWDSKIKTPGVVAKIRAEYEQHAVGGDAVDETVMKARVTELNQTMAYWRRVALFAKSERDLHHEEFKHTLTDYNEMSINADDVYQRHPGALKQILEEFNKGYAFSSPMSEKVDSVDHAALEKNLESGKVLPASYFAGLGFPRKYADVDMDAELNAKAEKAAALGLQADFSQQLVQYLPMQAMPELREMTGGPDFVPHPISLLPDDHSHGHGGHAAHDDTHAKKEEHGKSH